MTNQFSLLCLVFVFFGFGLAVSDESVFLGFFVLVCFGLAVLFT